MGVRDRMNRNFRGFKISQKTDENNAPYIYESVKVDGKYVKGDIAPELFGKLSNIELKSTPYNGKDLKFFSLTLDDGEELNIINLSHGSLTRDLLNKLASDTADLSRDICISVYRKVSESEEGKTYYNAVAAVRDDETKELFSWFIHPKELPKIEVVTLKNGTKVIDSTDIDVYFETTILNKIKSKLNSSSTQQTAVKPTSSKSVEKVENVKEEVIVEENDDSDLPF